MTSAYMTQLQPWEEQTSPSPVDEGNPYERAFSTSPQRAGPPSPVIDTSNTLHRQLSGDPESPPPAWKRRSSVTHRSPENKNKVARSPSEPPNPRVPPASRRHPNLSMTTANALPNGMFMHDSPPGSSTSLNDLALPNPSFRRRPGTGSPRSSVHSQDLSGMTSEELWALEHNDGPVPDLANPTRPAAERPLDTVRRMSKLMDQKQTYQAGLPADLIWPSAPPVEEIYNPPVKSKSVTSMASLNRGATKSRLGRHRSSRQNSMDVAPISPAGVKAVDLPPQSKSTPVSPVNAIPSRQDPAMPLSAHSSSTSLSSQNILPHNKSQPQLGGRPPSVYYSRDFLSSLAPREGGYAIAAQMGNGLGAVGAMSVEEKRKSMNFDGMMGAGPDGRGKRAPMAKSAGMGRWSLDGGEHFGGHRPYTTRSAATTSSNLSGPPMTSPEPSPPADGAESVSSFPEGAFQPLSATSSLDRQTTPPQGSTTSRIAPSPLSQQVNPPFPPPAPAVVAETIAQPSTSTVPAPTAATPATLTPKKSKKELAKEAKAAEKAAAQKLSRERAEKARREALAKAEERRKEKEEKARIKAEKKKGKLKSPSVTALAAVNPFKRTHSDVPPVPPVPTAARVAEMEQQKQSVPFPKTNDSPAASPVASAPRQTARSMPLQNSGAQAAPSSTQRPRAQPEGKPSRSFIGTIRKRFSILGPASGPSSNGARAGPSSSSSSAPRNAPTPPPKAAQELVTIPAEPSTPTPSQQAASVAHGGDLPTIEATPPRTSSMRAMETAPPATPASPTAFMHSPSHASASPLAKTLSREPPSSLSPSSSIHRRTSSSVKGPRAMPGRTSDGASPPPPASIPTFPPGAEAPSSPSFPFRSKAPLLGGGGDLTTPSTSDSAHSHGTDRFSGEGEADSRKTSLTSADAAESPGNEVLGGELAGDGPKRESSKSSEETVHPKGGETIRGVELAPAVLSQ